MFHFTLFLLLSAMWRGEHVENMRICHSGFAAAANAWMF